MANTNIEQSGPIRLRYFGWAMVGFWTLAVGTVLVWELIEQRKHSLEVARSKTRGAFAKDIAFRRWNASHGGLYVPVTEKTPPNPYLTGIPEQNITTPSGRRLTLVNPAYMMRQLQESTPAEDGVISHLTSLRPIRAGNAPDAWQREALEAFERGVDEVSSVSTIEGESYMRLMRPLIAEQSCLRCHAEQQYEVGDIRGGISVSVPMASVWPLEKTAMIQSAAAHGMMWVLGLCGIALASRNLRRQIEHRQQTEEELRETRSRLREIAVNIPGVVYQFQVFSDGTYSFPYISKGVTQILGITPEEVRRDALALFPGMLHEEDTAAIWQSIDESVEKMTTWQRELRFRSTRGEIKWIRATSRPRSLPDGSIIWNGVFLDVTDRKQAEARLQEAHDTLEQRVAERTSELEKANRELHREIADRQQAEKWMLESEERFRSCFELGLVGMAITSPENDWIDVNSYLCGILGYSEEELLGKTWADLTHPDDLDAERDQYGRLIEGAVDGYSVDKRFLRKDGKIVHADFSVRCLRRQDGTIDSLLAMVQDSTKLKQAEEEARAARQQVLQLQQRERQRPEDQRRSRPP